MLTSEILHSSGDHACGVGAGEKDEENSKIPTQACMHTFCNKYSSVLQLVC